METFPQFAKEGRTVQDILLSQRKRHASGASKHGGNDARCVVDILGGKKNSVTLYTVSDCEFRNLIIFGLFS